MRKNLAALTGNTFVSMEEMDATQNELHTQMQLENELDTGAISNEIQSISDSRVALENLHESLLLLKQQGKGLSMESSRFVQLYMNDINDKIGTTNKTVSLESYSDDYKRLDVALESVKNKLASMFMVNWSGIGWIVVKAVQYFQDAEAKNIQLKRDLESAIQKYSSSGKTNSEEIGGSFGGALLKNNTVKPGNNEIISNVKQYVKKVNDPVKRQSIETIIDSGSEIIKMVRSNWFFTSTKENRELTHILENLKSAITNYAETENDVIGQGRLKLEFDDEGEPNLQKNLTKEITGHFTFKPLDENEFKELSQELIKLADINIETGKDIVKLLDKMKSTMGWTFVNNIFRVGPWLTATVAGIATGLVAGPVAGAVVNSALNGAFRVPSRDLYQAMRYNLFVSILQEYMRKDAMQRAKVLAEGTMLIKKSTA